MKTYLALNNNLKIRKESSSGGVFYELAKYVLDKHGIVFGAAWNADWLVDLKYIDKLTDLPQLMGSKYVKANPKNTFKECKEFLDQGKIVLFCSIGCQLHALKKYLAKNYTNLYLCEICCHGTLPINIWKDYLESIKRNSKIIDIKMRDKSDSWEDFCFTIKYADGFTISEGYTKNKYIKAFLSDKYLTKGCYNCNFKNDNSVADIIIGDLWSIKDKSSVYYKYNDHNGCSFIETKTNKLVDILPQLNLLLVEIPYTEILKLNGGTHNTIDTIKQATYNKNIFNKQCGIISLPLHSNIGGYLQSFALKRTIENLGYGCDVINYTPAWYKKPALSFIKEINPFNIKDKNSYTEILKNKYDNIIVGSDQIWRPKYVGGDIRNSFLDFAKDHSDINKITYGVSFGADQWEYNTDQEILASKLIQEFSGVSVREYLGKDFCKKYLNTDATQVLDPTLLLDKAEYLELCKHIPHKTAKIFTYFLDNATEYRKYLKSKKYDIFSCDETNIYEWLACFRDCQYVITDSYHGCLFSIIFNKPFICIENKDRGLSRFNTIKALFNIKNNFIADITKLPTAWTLPEIKLDELKAKSISWLKTNLLNEPKAKADIEKAKNIKVCLCGIGKNENKYVREWVEHYKSLGFDKIFLFDNNDIDGEKYTEVIADYINNKFVEVLDVRGLKNAQIQSYNKLYQDHEKLKNFDWVAFFDLDEFLFIDNNKNIKTLLLNKKYDQYNCIAFNWKYFDDNNQITVNLNNYNVKKRFTHEFKQNPATKYNEYTFTKRIVRCNIPGVVINSSHGPVDRQSTNESIYCETLKNTNINCCNVAGKKIAVNDIAIFDDWSWDGAHLRHYRFKTLEEYVNNKMKRGYPTLYKNEGKDLNLNDFFRLNLITDEKLAWLDAHKIPYDKTVINKLRKAQAAANNIKAELAPKKEGPKKEDKRADGQANTYLYF